VGGAHDLDHPPVRHGGVCAQLDFGVGPLGANAAQALNLQVFSSNYGITSTAIFAKNGG
jgi:hypothetical protein